MTTANEQSGKDRTAYTRLASVVGALANSVRLELIELLAQCSRTVDDLARVADLPVATVSHHLRKLLAAGLVRRTARGREAVYSLRDEQVAVFWAQMRLFADGPLATPDDAAAAVPAVDTPTMRALVRDHRATLLDVRPAVEHAAGHLPTARSIPLGELRQRLDELPRDRLVVAICRGAYCRLADAAVALLQSHGYTAMRYAAGVAEWRAAGGKVTVTKRTR